MSGTIKRLTVVGCIVVTLGAIAIYVISFIAYLIGPTMRERLAKDIDDLVLHFERTPDDSDSLDAIREIVRSGDSFARTYACGALRRLGKAAGPATPDLISALQSGDPFVEREAALALGEVAIDDARALKPLMDKLQFEDRDVGWFSAQALGKIGAVARPAIPALEHAASSKNAIMSDAATRALNRLK